MAGRRGGRRRRGERNPRRFGWWVVGTSDRGRKLIRDAVVLASSGAEAIREARGLSRFRSVPLGAMFAGGPYKDATDAIDRERPIGRPTWVDEAPGGRSRRRRG